jgi:hypothetical protein
MTTTTKKVSLVMVDDHLPATQLPEFYSPGSGAHLAGTSPQTLRRNLGQLQPDAWLLSETGKQYPLFRRETLEAWREAQGGAE